MSPSLFFRPAAACLFSVAGLAFTSRAISQTPTPAPAITATGHAVPPDAAAWFSRDFPGVTADRIVIHSDNPNVTFTEVYLVQNAAVADCQLIVTSETHVEQPPDPTPRARRVEIRTIPFGAINLAKVELKEMQPEPGVTYSKPGYFLLLHARSGTGNPFSYEEQSSSSKRPKRDEAELGLRIKNRNTANLFLHLLRAAAVGCGAPDFEPVLESPESPKQQQAQGMTNDVVVSMAAAALSDDVIVNAIRQAANTSFDVTPTALIALKKAKVSDGVIAAMQTAGAPKPAPSEKTNAHYDSALAEQPKASAPSAPCAGIEMMGLYQNDLVDRQMGGGLVEWLAKIRNNTSVTRIVRFSWTDQYGQEKSGQVEIQGGNIATPRLDLTRGRYIAPVKDLKIVSCQ